MRILSSERFWLLRAARSLLSTRLHVCGRLDTIKILWVQFFRSLCGSPDKISVEFWVAESWNHLKSAEFVRIRRKNSLKSGIWPTDRPTPTPPHPSAANISNIITPISHTYSACSTAWNIHGHFVVLNLDSILYCRVLLYFMPADLWFI